MQFCIFYEKFKICWIFQGSFKWMCTHILVKHMWQLHHKHRSRYVLVIFADEDRGSWWHISPQKLKLGVVGSYLASNILLLEWNTCLQDWPLVVFSGYFGFLKTVSGTCLCVGVCVRVKQSAYDLNDRKWICKMYLMPTGNCVLVWLHLSALSPPLFVEQWAV